MPPIQDNKKYMLCSNCAAYTTRITIIIFTLVFLLLPACSSNQPKTQLELANTHQHQDNAGLKYVELPDTNIIQVFDLTNPTAAPFFMIQLKTCPANNQKKLAGQARQILVGFENLQIHSQTLIDRPIEAIQLLASASFEGQAVDLLSFSFINSDCLHDIVYFSNTIQNEEQSFWQDLELLDRLKRTTLSTKINA